MKVLEYRSVLLFLVVQSYSVLQRVSGEPNFDQVSAIREDDKLQSYPSYDFFKNTGWWNYDDKVLYPVDYDGRIQGPEYDYGENVDSFWAEANSGGNLDLADNTFPEVKDSEYVENPDGPNNEVKLSVDSSGQKSDSVHQEEYFSPDYFEPDGEQMNPGAVGEYDDNVNSNDELDKNEVNFNDETAVNHDTVKDATLKDTNDKFGEEFSSENKDLAAYNVAIDVQPIPESERNVEPKQEYQDSEYLNYNLGQDYDKGFLHFKPIMEANYFDYYPDNVWNTNSHQRKHGGKISLQFYDPNANTDNENTKFIKNNIVPFRVYRFFEDGYNDVSAEGTFFDKTGSQMKVVLVARESIVYIPNDVDDNYFMPENEQNYYSATEVVYNPGRRILVLIGPFLIGFGIIFCCLACKMKKRAGSRRCVRAVKNGDPPYEPVVNEV